jgi:hypothetical protein
VWNLLAIVSTAFAKGRLQTVGQVVFKDLKHFIWDIVLGNRNLVFAREPVA